MYLPLPCPSILTETCHGKAVTRQSAFCTILVASWPRGQPQLPSGQDKRGDVTGGNIAGPFRLRNSYYKVRVYSQGNTYEYL